MKVLVVNNLHAGQGGAGLYEYVRELGRLGAEVTLRTFSDGDFTLLLRDSSEFDRIVPAGGDGTVSSVAYLLRDTGIPVLPYPSGTANLLAFNLQLPADPSALARLTYDGEVARADLGEFVYVTSSPPLPSPIGFAVMAGAGFDAKVIEGARELKPLLGPGAYFVSAMQNLTPVVSRFTLGLDGRRVETEGIAVILVNFAKLQFDLSVTHQSNATDGLIEAVVINTKNVAGLLPAVWAALLDRIGQYPDRPKSLEIHSARSITVDADPDLPLQYDGEILGATTPFEARVLPSAATFVVPAGSPLLKST